VVWKATRVTNGLIDKNVHRVSKAIRLQHARGLRFPWMWCSPLSIANTSQHTYAPSSLLFLMNYYHRYYNMVKIFEHGGVKRWDIGQAHWTLDPVHQQHICMTRVWKPFALGGLEVR
jgi:hypothetical protein